MRERLAKCILILKDYLTYWRYSLTRHKALDFVSMGLGIQARYRRYMSEWGPHLNNTKLFIEQEITSLKNPGAIAVLGAGRLLDFPANILNSGRYEFDLFDYDPSLMPIWLNLRRSHHSLKGLYCRDVTGVLELWTKRLRQLSTRTSIKEFMLALANLPPTDPPIFRLDRYSCVVSLNVLSQLGLYWRDRVMGILVERGIVSSLDQEIPLEIEEALQINIVALEKSHLAMLNQSGAERIVVVSDTNYLYYRSDVKVVQKVVAIESEIQLLNYQVKKETTWDWQIAPVGAEGRDYGEMHQVVAKSFCLSSALEH